MSQTSKTLQEKMDQLSTLIAWFDGDEFALDKAIEKFKSAEKVAQEIEDDLGKLKNDIVVLKQKFDSEA